MISYGFERPPMFQKLSSKNPLIFLFPQEPQQPHNRNPTKGQRRRT